MKTRIHNFKVKECCSCKYYAGSREYKNGFLSTSFDVDDRAQCTKGKGNSKDGTTLYSWYCSHYERSGDVEAYIQKEIINKELNKKKKEVEFYQSQQNEIKKRQLQEEKYEIEQERKALEKKRKRLEHERWLNSLSPEERKVAEENEEIEKEYLRYSLMDDLKCKPLKDEMNKYHKRQERRKLSYFISFGALLCTSLLFLCIFLWVFYTYDMYELSTCIFGTILFLFSTSFIFVPILLHLHWKAKEKQIEDKLKEKKQSSILDVFLEALCYVGTQNAILIFIENKQAKKEKITFNDEENLISAIKNYFVSRKGEPLICMEDVIYFITVLLASDTINGEELKAIQDIILKTEAIPHMHQTKQMKKMIEEVKEKYDFCNMTSEEYNEKLEKANGILESYLLNRARVEQIYNFGEKNQS